MTPSSNRTDRAAALHRARARATGTPDDPSWPLRLAEDLRGIRADWKTSAEVCADAAWAARSAGRSVLGLLSPEDVLAADSDPIITRTLAHLYLSALRFDFRCLTLQRLVERLAETARRPLDCYTRALYAFALLGQSRPEGLAVMDEVLAEAEEHPKTLHVLLHGLWLGQDLDQGAGRLLAFSSRPALATGSDPIVLFRVAGALRRLGRYDEGLGAIDRAIDCLPPGDISVHADLVRERSLICAARDLQQYRSTIHTSSGAPS
jgi:tetratricopeptide (TPR) repeat protein